MDEVIAGTEPRIPRRHIPRDERVPFDRKFYRRTRWATHAVVIGVGLSCLLYDWDSYLGTDQHMFAGIRPRVKQALNWIWDVDSSTSNTADQSPKESQQGSGKQ